MIPGLFFSLGSIIILSRRVADIQVVSSAWGPLLLTITGTKTTKWHIEAAVQDGKRCFTVAAVESYTPLLGGSY